MWWEDVMQFVSCSREQFLSLNMNVLYWISKLTLTGVWFQKENSWSVSNGHRGNQFTAPVGVFFVYESSFVQYSMEIERRGRVRINLQYILGRQAQFLNLLLYLLTPHWIWMSYRPMSLALFSHRFPSITWTSSVGCCKWYSRNEHIDALRLSSWRYVHKAYLCYALGMIP